MKKNVLILAAAAVLAASVSISATADETVKVRVGDQAAFFLVKVAEEKGFFEEEFAQDGIEIESEIFAKMGPAIIEAMAAGDVDLSIVGVFPVVNANNNGNQITILASGNYTEDGFRLVTGPESEIGSVEELAGQKVGIPFGTAEHQITLQILEKHGIADQVELVNLQQADALTALLAGEIQAALFNSGTLNAAEEAGGITLATNQEIGLIVNPVIGRKAFVEENPEITSRFLKVLDKTAAWIDENEDETVQIASAITGTDEESTRVSLVSRGRKISVSDEYLAGPVQATLDFAAGQGLIGEDITYESIVDTSYFEAAGITEKSNE
jgi:sulfonate transport system substrate-binding protein